MNICTIIAKNYLAHARVLAESFRETHPDGSVSVLVVDDVDGCFDPADEPFEVLGLDQVGLEDPERMAASYDVLELSTAVKPWLLRRLLERQGVDSVTYLDPDIRIFDSLEEVERRARRHEVVLTPHFTAPLPRDGAKPSEEDILIAGAYNLGFIALGQGPTTEALLDWWSERLENDCVVDPGQGRFVDQRWIDLAPGLWPGIEILRDPGFNLAYWNLASRNLEAHGSGYRVDGEPLRFFHFSGFDPARPAELSRHQDRIEVGANPALARICSEYAERLRARGIEQAQGWPYGWEETATGLKLDRAARRLHREAVGTDAIEGSVFTLEGAERFSSHLNGSGNGAGANGGVNRYGKAVWESRPDLRQAFPDIEGRDAAAFKRWLREAESELGGADRPAPAASNGAVAASRPAPRMEHGVNVVGYLSSERGVGEIARQIYAALRVGGGAASAIDTPTDPGELAQGLDVDAAEAPFDVNLICVNADMLPAVVAAAGPGLLEGRHTVGLWFWEVSRFPERWSGSFQHVDEVWVASEHVARSLRPLSPVPVETMRLPIVPGPAAELSRRQLGMPEGFCFLFVFDYRSVFRRKNPLGIVSAFRAAFAPDSGPSLVIKSVFGEEFPAERAALAEAVRDRSDIHLIEATLAPEEKNAMIAGCDCYVSLHRSEGLGLTMAEAMYFGRPVIATAYSGNLDFMTAENSYLVSHTMAEIGPDAPPYPPDVEWAEPDLDRAAALMREVYEDPDAAAERGRRAAAEIRYTHSPEAAREAIEERLTEARRERLAAGLRPPDLAAADAGGAAEGRAQLEHLLSFGGAPIPAGAGRLRGSFKRLYMRLLRPYAAHQQRIDTSVAASLDELRTALTAVLELQSEAEQGARKREGLTRAALAEAAARLEDSGRELRSLALEVGAGLERNGAEVAAVRAGHEDLSADAASAIAELRERAAEANALVQAAAAQPYMADERLTSRTHLRLGETLGFRGSPQDGSEGYRGFEDLFRGTEAMIRERQRVYLDLVAGHAPVLDAGCGRGEFLDLLSERGVEFRGVDLDPEMVARCHEKGHRNVEQGDLLEYLERTPPGSLGTIFSAQVVEHLELDQLQRFLEIALSRLRPGGLLIAETVNPHSAAALKAFWVDPTHVRPLFPETMLALCQLSGFENGDVFAPLGAGDWERDRVACGEYAIVAVAPERTD